MTPLAKPVLEMHRINAFLAQLPNIGTQILVMILVLTDHLTIFLWEIIIAKLVTPLAKPVLEFLPINVFLVQLPNISCLILVMILALTDHLTMFQWEIIFAKLVTLLVKPVLEMHQTNVFLVHQPNICTLILVMIFALMEVLTT